MSKPRRSARQDDKRLVWTVRSKSFWLAGFQMGIRRGRNRDPGLGGTGTRSFIFQIPGNW